MKAWTAVAALALTLVGGAARAQQPTSAASRDSSAVRDSVAAARARTGPDPCADPLYLQLRQIPLNAMSDTQRRDLDELDRTCTEARLAAARRKMSRATAPYPGHVDYGNEVVPWVLGVGFFCVGVVTVIKTFQ